METDIELNSEFDIETLFFSLEDDFLFQDENFNKDLDALVLELSIEPVKSTFSCTICSKKCISQRGLTRHTNSQHKGIPSDLTLENPKPPILLSEFKSLLDKSITTLIDDECYPDLYRNELRINYAMLLETSQQTLSLLETTIASFQANGDAEKFYPQFYKDINCDIFINYLSKKTTRLLGCELCNHVLAFLTNSFYNNSLINLNDLSSFELSDRDKEIILYLSGYVFSTFYCRVRSSRLWQQKLSTDCLSLLNAGKIENFLKNPEPSTEFYHKFVNAKNRGGLWKVSPPVLEIFTKVEVLFRQQSNGFVKKIDSELIVTEILKNSVVMASISELRSLCTNQVSKELSLNLFYHLVTLYVRVRSFSYAKEKLSIHKLKENQTKSKSLRSKMKKTSIGFE